MLMLLKVLLLEKIMGCNLTHSVVLAEEGVIVFPWIFLLPYAIRWKSTESKWEFLSQAVWSNYRDALNFFLSFVVSFLSRYDVYGKLMETDDDIIPSR